MSTATCAQMRPTWRSEAALAPCREYGPQIKSHFALGAANGAQASAEHQLLAWQIQLQAF
jgi:hypothetical protein